MTEKRFVYYEHKGADYILDTPNKSLDFIEMLGDCLEAEEIVDLLNQLYDENEQLKQRNEFLKKRCDEYWEEAGLIMIILNEGKRRILKWHIIEIMLKKD